jgi:DNA-binding CsgD family transcriptional regulator
MTSAPPAERDVDRHLGAAPPARTNIIGWLRVVARREAIRLAQYDHRLTTLTPRDHDRRAVQEHRPSLEAREALGLLAALPPRKRAVLALQVSGHSYREMAAEMQMTERTVERQLLRARVAVRRADAQCRVCGAASLPSRVGKRRPRPPGPALRAHGPSGLPTPLSRAVVRDGFFDI